MSIGFTFTVIWFIVAIALPTILEKRGFGITNESAGILCIILVILSLHPFFIASIIASKLKTPPESLKQKKYAVDFSSYDELIQYCEPLLIKYDYQKIFRVKTKEFGTDISAYARPTEDDDLFCFAVSYCEALSEESFEQIRAVTVNAFGSFAERVKFNRGRDLRRLHYINLICVDEENEAFKKIQQMPTVNYYPPRRKYAPEVGRSDMFMTLSFARNILFMPEPFYGDVFDGSNPKRFYKIHKEELSVFLDLSKEIE